MEDVADRESWLSSSSTREWHVTRTFGIGLKSRSNHPALHATLSAFQVLAPWVAITVLLYLAAVGGCGPVAPLGVPS
jgi:hypothetical protein